MSSLPQDKPSSLSNFRNEKWNYKLEKIETKYFELTFFKISHKQSLAEI